MSVPLPHAIPEWARISSWGPTPRRSPGNADPSPRHPSSLARSSSAGFRRQRSSVPFCFKTSREGSTVASGDKWYSGSMVSIDKSHATTRSDIAAPAATEISATSFPEMNAHRRASFSSFARSTLIILAKRRECLQECMHDLYTSF